MKRMMLTLTIAAMFAATASAGILTKARSFVHRITHPVCCCTDCSKTCKNCNCSASPAPVVPAPAALPMPNKCDCPPVPAKKTSNEA